ncbi:O-antigen ligase family protein [Candidatus Daviesbacteria bacterium]|nr:O-antigen ligase family protein [Candidatus Daviesbacteria bacterium]
MTLANLERTLLFLVLLFLPTQLGRHFWPQFSFIYSLPIDYLSPTLYFWDILVIVLWVVCLFSGKHINRLALTFFYFFILTQTVSLLFNPQALGVGFIRLEQYLIAGLFGVYIASTKWAVLRAKLYTPLAFAVLFESTLAILQFLKEGTIGLWILGERSFSLSTPGIAKFDFYGREFLRPYGTFPHPNILAAFMVITVVILSSLRKQGSINKTANWIPAFAGMTTLLTFSRTAIIAGLASALLILKTRGRLLLLLVIFLLMPILYTRFAAIFNYDQLTFLRREELTRSALELFWKNPVSGVGLNNFIPSLSSELISGPSRFLQPVHNIFLLALSETGMLGLLGWLGLLGYPILKQFPILPVGRQISNLACRQTGLKSCLSADRFPIIWGTMLFLGLFDHYFLTLPQGIRLLFLIWGLSLSMLELKA